MFLHAAHFAHVDAVPGGFHRSSPGARDHTERLERISLQRLEPVTGYNYDNLRGYSSDLDLFSLLVVMRRFGVLSQHTTTQPIKFPANLKLL